MEKIIIGNAELYHGDCMEILPTLEPVDAVVTDPPYGIKFRSEHRTEKYDPIINDCDNRVFLWACEIPVLHSRYVFCRWEQLQVVTEPKSCITWVKNNWSMGDLAHEHARQTEMILFWPGPNHFFPQKRPTDVLDARRTGNTVHPTEKPVYLMEHICRWTYGCILDPFMGSGTTGVACMNLNHHFIGIEMERKYFDIACERIDQAQRQERLFP